MFITIGTSVFLIFFTLDLVVYLFLNHPHIDQEFLEGTAPIWFISLAFKVPGIGLAEKRHLIMLVELSHYFFKKLFSSIIS